MNIYIFTRTRWDEEPRIRHQLARLLMRYKHEVYFFERPTLKLFKSDIRYKEGIAIIRHHELIHHQLRPIRLLHFINATYSRSKISRLLSIIPMPDLVINFNYDYHFLRYIFPKTKLITILNDDFVGMAKFWMKKEANRVINQTVNISDRVLTVSTYIQNNLFFNRNLKLLLPWSDSGYSRPNQQKNRDVVLYFGYIDSTIIDWKLFNSIVKNINYKVRIVGVINNNSAKSKLNNILKNKKVEFIGPMSVDNLNLSDVFCSIAPYNATHPGPRATTLSNRILQLLSKGIPFVITKLPSFINVNNNVMIKATTVDNFITGIDCFHSNFSRIQEDIKQFVVSNSSHARYTNFMEIVNGIKIL